MMKANPQFCHRCGLAPAVLKGFPSPDELQASAREEDMGHDRDAAGNPSVWIRVRPSQITFLCAGCAIGFVDECDGRGVQQIPVEPRAVPHSRRLFALGLSVRLLGVALIWAGDGSAAWWRKAVVVLGVTLSIGGIAVLRYLLLAGPLGRLGARWRPRP